MAPRKITPSQSDVDVTEEILFTRSALKADPNAEDLLPMTDTWMSMQEVPRQVELAAREATADAVGLRSVANHNLDAQCTKFGDHLFLDVQKDRDDPRWTQFFDRAVSRFTRMPLSQQINRVRGWLTAEDAILDIFREDLSHWADQASAAIVMVEGTAPARGKAAIARETLAEELTAARDGLHEVLAARARERKLGRKWPDVFFRKSGKKRRRPTDEPSEPTE